MDERTLAYLAGILDGEGCITITRKLDKRRANRLSYEPVVTVANTDARLMRWLEENVGGRVYTANAKSKARFKPMWQWRVVGAQNVRRVLEEVLPYLVCKDREAEIVLRFVKTIRNQPGRGVYRVPDEVKLARDRLYGEMRELHPRVAGNGSLAEGGAT